MRRGLAGSVVVALALVVAACGKGGARANPPRRRYSRNRAASTSSKYQ